MGYPINTSNDQWLVKARELYYKRVNINIEDDAEYFKEKELLNEFRKITIPRKMTHYLIAYYSLAIVCIGLVFLSLSIASNSILGVVLSSLGAILFIFIPTRIIIKNKPPNITIKESTIEIVFNRNAI